jgi:hypothetical protein
MLRLALTRRPGLFVVLAVTSVLGLAACAEDVRQEVYTTDDTAQIRSHVLNSDLSDAEKKSFGQELAREGYQPYGKTVSAILADAQRDDAADRRAAAAAAEQTRELNNDLKIYPTSISIVKGGEDFGSYHVDNPHEDKDTFTFLIQNNGSKSIDSFSADATLTNEGGEVLYTGSLNDATILAPGAQEKLIITTTPTDFSALPNPELVRQANIDNAVVHYTVQRIEYSDGSRVSRSE